MKTIKVIDVTSIIIKRPDSTGAWTPIEYDVTEPTNVTIELEDEQIYGMPEIGSLVYFTFDVDGEHVEVEGKYGGEINESGENK